MGCCCTRDGTGSDVEKREDHNAQSLRLMRLASAVHGGLLLSCKLHFTPDSDPAWKLQEEMQSVVPCTCAACSEFDKKEPEACYRSAGKWFHKEGRQVTVRINGPRKPGEQIEQGPSPPELCGKRSRPSCEERE